MNKMEVAVLNWVVSEYLSKVLLGQMGVHDLQNPSGSGYPDPSLTRHYLSS